MIAPLYGALDWFLYTGGGETGRYTIDEKDGIDSTCWFCTGRTIAVG